MLFYQLAIMVEQFNLKWYIFDGMSGIVQIRVVGLDGYFYLVKYGCCDFFLVVEFLFGYFMYGLVYGFVIMGSGDNKVVLGDFFFFICLVMMY